MPRACGSALSEPRSEVCRQVPPGADRRDLRHARNLELRVEERMILAADRLIGYSPGGSTFDELAGPVLPGVAAPEIVGPEEPALEQVLAQVRPLRSGRCTPPPSSVIMMNGQLNIAGSLRSITR